jgi:uncharacterized protein YndB with AHSA1/START domain
METRTFEYVTYVWAPLEKVWDALVDPKLTVAYWQHANISDWKPGSRWEHRRDGKDGTVDLVGRVVESIRPARLVLSWAFPADEAREAEHTRVSFDIEPYRGITRLVVRHERLVEGSEMLVGITAGWPKVLSSMKSFLESGRPLPVLW